MAEAEVLDDAALARLLETVGGDRTFVAELVEAYLADSPGLLAEMRSNVAGGDRTAVRRAAHTLKSTSASLGATMFAAACREVETSALEAEPAWLAARVRAVAGSYEQVASALRDRFGGAAA